MNEARANTFPKSRRLTHALEFKAVYDARVRESRGPLTAYALPNDRGHPRLGLSVSRKVGTAPRRNRIKRMLREAFRLWQHDLPVGYDFIVVVRPHEPQLLADYQRLLAGMAVRLHREWARRRDGGARCGPRDARAGGGREAAAP
jgi:ribonuclease P protein component